MILGPVFGSLVTSIGCDMELEDCVNDLIGCQESDGLTEPKIGKFEHAFVPLVPQAELDERRAQVSLVQRCFSKISQLILGVLL